MKPGGVMPLGGKRVLVTRPDGASLAELLRSRGAQVEAIPAIRFAPPDDSRPAAAALGTLGDGRFTWCVLASAQAAEAFFEGARAMRVTPPPELRYAAVGPKTRATIERYAAQAALMPDQFNASQTASALLDALTPRDHVLIFRAQEGSDAIAEALEARDIPVTAVAGYRTLPADDPRLAPAAGACDVWTFASGSAVQGLAANVPSIDALAQKKIIACIGAACAAVARQHGLEVGVLASTSTSEGLVDALEAYIAR